MNFKELGIKMPYIIEGNLYTYLRVCILFPITAIITLSFDSRG